MASLKLNFLSNFLGGAASTLILLAATPIYAKYLGASAFGLYGLYLAFNAFIAVLDAGLTPALSRELAILSINDKDKIHIRTTVRSVEFVYIPFCIILGILGYFALPLLASYWLNTSSIELSIVEACLQLMAIQFAFQLPISLYSGVFLGMQKHTYMNIINTSFTAVKVFITIYLLIFHDGNVIDFFIFQVILTALHLMSIALFLWSKLPEGVARFDKAVVSKLWDYAIGMFWITFLSVMLTQIDKIILSKILSLEEFGYYMIAWSLASLLLKPAMPVFLAWLPKMTQHAEKNATAELKAVYHSGSWLINLLTVPIGVVFIIFSEQILFIYTRNEILTQSTAIAFSMLSIGCLCNAIMHMPYALTLAYGWTKFAILQNILAMLLVVPVALYFSYSYGLKGAGYSWMLVNVLYLFLSLHFIHKRYLKGELSKWYSDNFTMYAKRNFEFIRSIFK